MKIGAPYEKIAEACKDAGFKAYGYGCPDALKDDMPYVASVNHVVPMSLYRRDGSFSYVDIFDPTGTANAAITNPSQTPFLIGWSPYPASSAPG